MFEVLLGRLIASLGMVARTFRAFFMRFVTGIGTRIRSVTSISRHASKLAPKVLDAAASTGKKPAKREDYIETGNLLISKSFLITVLLTIIIGAIVIATIVWPWIVSTFLTKHMWERDELVGGYTGKVMLYYDKEKTMPLFQGRLDKGTRVGKATTYDKNNAETFLGTYLDGEFEGKGKTFSGGLPVYDGEFKAGKYEGEGILYDEKGMVKYEGTFTDGEYEGKGKLYKNGNLIYEGTFEKGEYNGNGVEYWVKKKVYEGKFENGLYEGKGKLYERGEKVYEGDFSQGKRSGRGVAYRDGKVCYKGDFEDDLYNGSGVAYNKNGSIAFKGEFVDGFYSGDGELSLEYGDIVKGNFDHGSVVGEAKCYRDGKLWYEGSLKNYIPDGEGKIYSNSVMIYDGPIMAGTIDGAALTGLTMDEVADIFQNKGVRKLEEDGFSFNYPKLGASVVFSFATEDDEPRVKRFFLESNKNTEKLKLLVWEKVKDFEKFRESGYEAFSNMNITKGKNKDGYFATYISDNFKLSFLSKREDGNIRTYEWEGFEAAESGEPADAAEETSVTDAADEAQGKMNDLLDKIGIGAPGDDAADAGAAADGAGASSGGAASAAASAAAGGADAATAAAAQAAATQTAAAQAAATQAAAANAVAQTAAANTAAQPAAAAKKSPYYGTGKATEVIKKAEKSKRNTVIKNMVVYFTAAEKVTAAKQKNEQVAKAIEKAKTDKSMGEDTEERLKELNKSAKALQLEITSLTAEMAQCASTISSLTGGDNGSSADMSQVVTFFDVSAIDTEKLSQAAVKNALAKNSEEHKAAMEAYKDAAKKNAIRLEKAFEENEMDERIFFTEEERDNDTDYYRMGIQYNELKENIEELLKDLFKIQKPEETEINDQEIYKLLQTQMIELQIASQSIQIAKDNYEDAVKEQAAVEKKFKMGQVGEDALEDAKMQVMDSCTALYSNLSDFTTVASDMNDVSGGYLSESSGWMADAFKGDE